MEQFSLSPKSRTSPHTFSREGPVALCLAKGYAEAVQKKRTKKPQNFSITPRVVESDV
jgi:hypothetical protein